jgi:hypothetical protein
MRPPAWYDRLRSGETMKSPYQFWLSLLALVGCGGGFQDTTVNGLKNFAVFSPEVQGIYRVAHPTTIAAWLELQKKVQQPGKSCSPDCARPACPFRLTPPRERQAMRSHRMLLRWQRGPLWSWSLYLKDAKILAQSVLFVQLHDDVEGDDEPFTKLLGWDLLKVPMPPEDDKPWTVLELPKKTDVQRAIDAIWNAHLAGQVVVFGCVHARDRTSLVAAVLGMQKLGWTKDFAWKNMLDHGFRWELPDLDIYFATEVP